MSRRDFDLEAFMSKGLSEWYSFANGRMTRKDRDIKEVAQLKAKAAKKPEIYKGWKFWKPVFQRMAADRRRKRLTRRINTLRASIDRAEPEIGRRATRTRQRLFSTIMQAVQVETLVEKREHERGLEQPDQMRRFCSVMTDELRWVNRGIANVEAAIKAATAPTDVPPPQGEGLDLPTPPSGESISDEFARLATSMRNLSGSFISNFVEYPASEKLRSLSGKLAELRLHNLTLDTEAMMRDPDALTTEQATKALANIKDKMTRLADLVDRAEPVITAAEAEGKQQMIEFQDNLILDHAKGDEQQASAKLLLDKAAGVRP
ncbi:MAG: hypothetical protein Alpg2KO_23950 [Alphaproteobacteria bacterium]